MRKVVIVGANGGVGQALCTALSEDYVIALSRNDSNIKLLANEFHYIDVRHCDEVEKLFSDICSNHDRIDVLINAAAIFESTPFVDQDISNIGVIIDTNLMGVICTTKGVLNKMIQQGQGLIINISSVSGCHGIENQAVYSATKHALTGFGDSLNQEVISSGVKIVTLCPGGIDTGLWNEQNPYNGDVEKLISPATVADIAKFVMDLPNNVVMKKMIFFPNNEWH